MKLLSWFSLETVILFLLRTLQGITADEWRIALQSVIAAGKAYKDSADKRDFVLTALAGMKESAANLLLEVAVGYAKSKGKI